MPSSKPAPRPDASGASPAPAFLHPRTPGQLPWLMGIVNATPDSFHPDSRAATPEAAVELALRLTEEGADLIDLGGQSTRPGSDPVPEAEELRRVLPVVEELARRGLAVSIDTDKAEVARRALEAGALLLNDVTALRGDRAMNAVAARYPAVLLMHMKGTSAKTMQDAPSYDDPLREVGEFLEARKAEFLRAGGKAPRLLVDPGIGFGKDLEHNLVLLRGLERLSLLAPVVLGASRKSFLGRILAEPGREPVGPEGRLEGSLAVACWAAAQGVHMLRVHDVAATRRALKVWKALEGTP